MACAMTGPSFCTKRCESLKARLVGNWEVNFWFARQNEAAGAADAAA